MSFLIYKQDGINLNIQLSDLYYELGTKGIANFYNWMGSRSPYKSLQLLRNAINSSFITDKTHQIQSFKKKKRTIELYKEYQNE